MENTDTNEKFQGHLLTPVLRIPFRLLRLLSAVNRSIPCQGIGKHTWGSLPKDVVLHTMPLSYANQLGSCEWIESGFA